MMKTCQVVFLIFFVNSVNSYMGAMMGVLTTCDDAKTNLEIDWDPKDFTTYTCSEEKEYDVDQSVEPIIFDMVLTNSTYDPRADAVMHECMNTKLDYEDRIPVRGDHRPNWARFGEYLYCPVQRWLHNLEHGSIVLLYHPCANQDELQKLRTLVTSCLYRHVITPYLKLEKERPFALVGWASRMELNSVHDGEVVDFIKKYARRAPEEITRNGLYDQYLIREAKFVSDKKDQKICPNY